jgi:hypothetical protein
MGSQKLLENLDEARWTRYDPSIPGILVWFGGHAVHIYDSDGNEIDSYTIGDQSKSEATLAEVKSWMKRWIESQGET